MPAHPAGLRCADPITSPKIHPFISARPRAYPSTHSSDVRQIAIALTHSAKSSGEGEPAPGANRKQAAGAFCRLASPKYSWEKAACAGRPRRVRGRRRGSFYGQGAGHGADLLVLGRSRRRRR